MGAGQHVKRLLEIAVVGECAAVSRKRRLVGGWASSLSSAAAWRAGGGAGLAVTQRVGIPGMAR